MHRRAVRIVSVATLIAAGCGGDKAGREQGGSGPENGARHADAPLVVTFAPDDPRVDAAARQARSTLAEFTAALRDPRPGQDSFAVKARFVDGQYVEDMWITQLQYEQGRFTGRIDNDPTRVSNVSYGQRHSVSRDEILDWMYTEDGRIVGGFSLQALLQAR